MAARHTQVAGTRDDSFDRLVPVARPGFTVARALKLNTIWKGASKIGERRALGIGHACSSPRHENMVAVGTCP